MIPSTTRHTKRLVLLCVLFNLFAAGCSTAPSVDTSGMIPVALPEYHKGTTFIYSNGTWETVVEVTAEAVTWKNHKGYFSSGPVDFTYRRSSWETRTRQGSREFAPRSDVIIKKPTTLWPLKIGNAASFTETGRWSPDGGEEKTYTALWSCEVTGTERVSVMAGEFETLEIVCKRYSKGSAGRLSRLREVKSFKYAPAVGHTVLTTSRYTSDRASRRIELLAVVPPDSDRSAGAKKKMERSFQLALESRSSGKPVPWSDGRSKAAGTTTPVDTFELPDGTFCRRYVQQVNSDEGNNAFYGMACRNDQGRWVVPRQ